MPPPGRPVNSGPGSNGGGQLIQFPSRPATEVTDTPASAPVSSTPSSSDPISSRISRPDFHSFSDFSDLAAKASGRSPKQSVGAYGLVQLYLEILANPLANGGYGTRFIRENRIYEMSQERPDDPIRVKMFKETPSHPSAGESGPSPKFQLTYFPNGEIAHTALFDSEGRAVRESRVKPNKLRSAALGDHETTLDFLRKRAERLGDGCDAFKRLEAPLQQLRPSVLDLAKRGAWYRNFVVMDGKVYSLRTQNLGFGGLGQYASQNLISIFEDQGARNIELFQLSKTGEINYAGEGSARRPPHREQLALLNHLSHQLETAQTDPLLYQERLHDRLKVLETSLSAKYERPEISRTPMQWTPNPSTRGMLGEPIQTITNGRDLWRIIHPFTPQTWRWENPENPEDVRYLRPKGRIRGAMAWELVRWFGNSFWNGTINHITNLKPQAGELKLHLLPDGSTELEIYRNYTQNFPDGTLREERGIYNVLRRNIDKTVINLGSIVKQIAKKQPDIFYRPRAEQLKLASQTLIGSSDLPRSLYIQSIPDLPIDQLRVGKRGPHSAVEAWEALYQLPQLQEAKGIRTQAQSEVGGNFLSQATGLGPETRFELTFPGSQPPTHVVIQQEAHTTGKRVAVYLWQGDNVATAVYDDGILNQHESARLNKAEVYRARQGTLDKAWYKILGKGFAQVRTYTEIQGLAYFVGFATALPAALAWERAFWTPEQRRLAGTPIPELTYRSIKNEFWAAMTMGGFGGGTAIGVDAFFNYGGGLVNTAVDKFEKGVGWREAYRYNSPRWMSPPPARFRPIPKPSIGFRDIPNGSAWTTAGRSLKWGMPYLRNILQRGLPLFSGLFALECYRSLGPNWKMRDVIFGDYKPNWDNMKRNIYHVGTVSLLSSSAWGLASRRTELALARRAAGHEIAGLGGVLLRNKLLAQAPGGMAGARFAMTYRAALLTAGLEMAALGIWDSMDRKEKLIDQEKVLRAELSQSIDSYNRILSRLQNGEEIAPAKLQAAESEVVESFQGYRSYLKMMGRENGSADHKSLGMENEFGSVYRAMKIEALTGGSEDIPQWDYQNKLQQMREKDAETETQFRELYRSHGLSVEDPEEGPGLREFLARTTQTLKDDPEALDKALAPRPAVPSPITLDSPKARALIGHLNWKVETDRDFLKQSPDAQARYILKTFSGYRVTLSDGTLRPWKEEEAIAFLNDLLVENRRRLENGKPPLLKPDEKSIPSPEALEKLAEEERKMYEKAAEKNPHLKRIAGDLAENGAALEKQIQDYLKQSSEKRDHSLVQFFPESSPLSQGERVPEGRVRG